MISIVVRKQLNMAQELQRQIGELYFQQDAILEALSKDAIRAGIDDDTRELMKAMPGGFYRSELAIYLKEKSK